MNVPHDKMKSSDGYEERYGQQTMLPQVGLEGQRKLSKSRILVIGAGGLGSPVALYLAAAGIGLIGIVDDDNVDLSNLQRQVLHNTGDIGTPKAASAKGKISLSPSRQGQTSHQAGSERHRASAGPSVRGLQTYG